MSGWLLDCEEAGVAVDGGGDGGDYWGGACGCLVGNVYIEFGVWIEFLKE